MIICWIDLRQLMSMASAYAGDDRHGLGLTVLVSYSTPFKSSGRRFMAVMSVLLVARLGVGTNSNNTAKMALLIATRYAHMRRQFGQPGSETLLIDYPGHQRRLIPLIASTYAYCFAGNYVKLRLEKWFMRLLKNPLEDMREMHVLAGLMKAMGSWHMIETLQQTREACGGMGYLAYVLCFRFSVLILLTEPIGWAS